MLGTAGGISGTGFASPQAANIISPTTAAQANTAYTGNQQALQQQQAFLNALQAQNGIQNQSNVFGQLQNVAAGQGPNPAMAQLAQATGANVANQASLMAGQRGAQQNVGMIARQAAQQGAQTQQQAAGQGATMQAQQSLAALGQLSGIAGQQVGQQQQATGAVTGAQQSEQQNLLNSIAQQNNANVGMQSNINSANTALAQTGMQQQANLMGNMMPSAGQVMQMFADGGAVDTNTIPGNPAPIPQSPGQSQSQDKSGGGSGGGAGKLLALLAEGGQPQMPQAPIAPAMPQAPQKPASGPQSQAGKYFSSQSPKGAGAVGSSLSALIAAGLHSLFTPSQYQPQQQSPGQPSAEDTTAAYMGAPGTRDANNLPTADATYNMMKVMPDQKMADGGKVPAMVSPGEQYLKPQDVEKVKKGADPLAVGEKIPGKPKHPGNDYRNDVVPKDLDEGGVVIPNKVMQSKNPHWEAMKFVKAYMAKGGKVPAAPKKARK